MPPKKETKLFLPLVPMQAQWYRKVLMLLRVRVRVS